MHSLYRDHLSQRFERRGITVSSTQLERLTRYVEHLMQWRRRINLTGLHQAERVMDVLVVESLDFLQRSVMASNARVLDLGTGAGVPGVPLAICAPDLQLTLLDRTEKKITFLRHIIPRLELRNCRPYCNTAEAYGGQLPTEERFDVVVTRGVGRVNDMLRLAAPLLRPGGALVLRKPYGSGEIQEAMAGSITNGWSELYTIPVSEDEQLAWVLVVALRDADRAA
jgi:16S rRNA (guanine527-N7)-methyltransferase